MELFTETQQIYVYVRSILVFHVSLSTYCFYCVGYPFNYTFTRLPLYGADFSHHTVNATRCHCHRQNKGCIFTVVLLLLLLFIVLSCADLSQLLFLSLEGTDVSVFCCCGVHY